MSMYNGNEFDSEKGTQGGLLKFIWSKIYTKFTDVSAAISTALANYYTKTEVDAKETALQTAISNESTDRATAISTLQSTLQTAIDAKTTTAEVATQITSAIDALVAGAPAALDTLKEISDALASNEAGDTATATALNALITTVNGKASQESVDALATDVAGKASAQSVTDLANTVANTTVKGASYKGVATQLMLASNAGLTNAHSDYLFSFEFSENQIPTAIIINGMTFPLGKYTFTPGQVDFSSKNSLPNFTQGGDPEAFIYQDAQGKKVIVDKERVPLNDGTGNTIYVSYLSI